jgi:hypothetical protein
MSRSSMYCTRRSMLLWQGTWQTDGWNEVFNYIDCVYFIFKGEANVIWVQMDVTLD